MSRHVRRVALSALGFWLVVLVGAAFANHELGPPPNVYVDEFAKIALVTVHTQCPVHYIEYETGDYTAKAGEDYISVSGRLTGPPWKFEVPILQDSIKESDEFVKVLISAGARTSSPGETAPSIGGGCGGASMNSFVVGKITIIDDEVSPETNVATVENSNQPDTESSSRGTAISSAPAAGQSADAMPAPVLERMDDEGEAAEGSDERRDAPVGQASSMLRFVVVVGILGLGATTIFAFSSRRSAIGLETSFATVLDVEPVASRSRDEVTTGI